MNIQTSPIPHLQKLLDLPFYTEGPAIANNGDIYFTTLTGNRVLKMDGNNKVTEWATAVCPNGQVILENGDHLVCDSMNATVARFDTEGTFIKNEIEGFCDHSAVFVPNDIIVNKNGGIYFTDSIRKDGKVFFISGDGGQLTIAFEIDYPNGLVLSHDETKLYVAESYRNRILVIPLKTSGVAEGRPEVYCTLPFHSSGRETDNLPDGLAIDNHSYVWVAHYGMQALQVISNKGVLQHSYNTDLPLTSNIFIRNNEVIITGGYGEPGPGALLKFNLDNLNKLYET